MENCNIEVYYNLIKQNSTDNEFTNSLIRPTFDNLILTRCINFKSLPVIEFLTTNFSNVHRRLSLLLLKLLPF